MAKTGTAKSNVQFIHTPGGGDLAVLPRNEYDRLVALATEAQEDAAASRVVRNSARALKEGPSARDAIERWLTGFVPFCSGVKGTRGCLSVNAAADGVSRKRIQRFNRKLEELLSNRLRADRAQFSDAFDPDVSAHAIMAIYLGLMVMAKDAPDAARVRATLNQAMKLLA